ncbi:MAG: OmpA family protein [Deltaproteobacteria bacterium]|nr:MAG: OmpA family protein [Deltaproteobacteria bacterium]
MKSFRLFVLAGGLLLLSACSGPKNFFVLMPDTDGAVGQISVQNDAGRQVITSARTAVKVKDTETAPSPPAPMSEKDIQKTFKQAMATVPRPSARFILHFKSGTTSLTKTSRALLPRIVETVQDRNPCDVRIVGHTDTAGDAEKNRELGLQRAESVKGMLVEQGIDADQVEAASHGEKDLLVPTPDNVAEPENRRVEVLVR